MLRFVHTADWQLGMPFHWLAGESAYKLREQRLSVIERISEVVRAHEAEFVLVAGDLFDANTISEKIVIEACERIASLPVPVLVIPGNHDHAGPHSIYRHATFLRECPQNLTVFTEPKAMFLEAANAWILAAPLQQRHEARDPTALWSRDMGGHNAPRIGIAHGSIRRFDSGTGTASNLIDPRRVETAELDYLALGDWHGTKRISERVWYAGTPEPTSFKDNDAGQVLRVEVSGRAGQVSVSPVKVARTHWHSRSFEVFSRADLQTLQNWLESLTDPRWTLVELNLRGSLAFADMDELSRIVMQWGLRLLHLRLRQEALHSKPSAAELDAIASDGYMRMALERLRDAQSQGDETAERALQLFYQLRQSCHAP